METIPSELVASRPPGNDCQVPAETPELRLLVIPACPLPAFTLSLFVKRLSNVCIALLALFPLFLVLGFLIWWEGKGPILYRQVRLGQYGVPFWFYKFRSMRVDADRVQVLLIDRSDVKGAAFKMKRDPRVTRVGCLIRGYSIDEMPQILSVLLGQMSIVGPRPHLACEGTAYVPHQRVPVLVKPGLLSLREVQERSDLSFEEWLKLNLDYVQSCSFLLDTKIFLMAFPAVLSKNGAH